MRVSIVIALTTIQLYSYFANAGDKSALSDTGFIYGMYKVFLLARCENK